MTAPPLVLLVLAVLLALALAGGCTAAPHAAAPDLGKLRVVAHPAHAPGYQRSCRPGRGCSFGPAWTDDNDDPRWGHDGCASRDQALARDLEQVALKPGTRGCVVVSGRLRDPYTGQVVEYRRGANPQPVQVDHVFGLASSWDRGAAAWPQARRTAFANDPRELQTTTASVNASKGDRTPAEWRPPVRAGWCGFARQFYDVATAYDLAVTPADVDALRAMLRTC